MQSFQLLANARVMMIEMISRSLSFKGFKPHLHTCLRANTISVSKITGRRGDLPLPVQKYYAHTTLNSQRLVPAE